MIKATFKKKSFWNIVCLLCGLFLIGLFVFIGYKDREATIGNILVGVFWGAIICIFCICILLFNFRAYLYIEDGYIKGKYHYFGKIECNTTDVDFVLPQTNTLTILLKNGKCHKILGIENAWLLSSEIRRQIFRLEPKPPKDLYCELKEMQNARKKESFWVFGGVALMFVNVFVAVLLTGGKELYDFDKLDWILFAVMGVIELATLMITFYFAGKCGKHQLPIEHLKYRLQSASISSQLPPPGNRVRVYTDVDCTGRVIVFGYPNNQGAYYCVQAFSESEFRLDTVYTSEIYESEDALAKDEEFYRLLDITAHFQ